MAWMIGETSQRAAEYNGGTFEALIEESSVWQVAVAGVANQTGHVLEIRPPKDVDLTLIAMLPIDVLVVHTSTAEAIREKVKRLACIRRFPAPPSLGVWRGDGRRQAPSRRLHTKMCFLSLRRSAAT
jgi:hypothetical protein